MKNRNGFLISVLAAGLTLNAAAGAAAITYPLNVLDLSALGYAPRAGDCSPAAPIPGVVLDNKGDPLPPCRRIGPHGVQVIRGAGAVP
jgi:hypothetical protein